MLATATLFSSCASIVSRTAYPVTINTNPSGASISITDKKGKEVYNGTSPAVVTLRSGAGYFSKAEYEVKLLSPGYAEKVVPIKYKLNDWYFGNILIGGVIGMLIVDPATGAMWRISNREINETLSKTKVMSTSSISTPTLDIVDIKDISKELKSELVRVN
jgi:hypothetical protein